MNKLHKVAALAALVAASVTSAEAATATSNFDVVVNLTGACKISTAPGTINVAHAAYTAATTGTTNFTVQCSQGLLYNVTMPLSGADNILTNLGLTNSVAITAGGSANVVGTNAGNNHTITASVGTVAEGGTCAVANPGTCSATNTYTLTISY